MNSAPVLSLLTAAARRTDTLVFMWFLLKLTVHAPRDIRPETVGPAIGRSAGVDGMPEMTVALSTNKKQPNALVTFCDAVA